MLRSLVGSEMCIRDRTTEHANVRDEIRRVKEQLEQTKGLILELKDTEVEARERAEGMEAENEKLQNQRTRLRESSLGHVKERREMMRTLNARRKRLHEFKTAATESMRIYNGFENGDLKTILRCFEWGMAVLKEAHDKAKSELTQSQDYLQRLKELDELEA
eukprot:TRINITY_DN46334_c0_g1_i1.p1 TRINITY_DN46334_c0_g1~~TRINITY_DN46334_c0_g1_i1.p1  ORF type:complete len:175 (+),score=49.65 TRINITY_DN46334_c0_g1_i1:42-527(+)